MAVLYAVGTIVSGSGGSGPTGAEVGSDKLTEYIREVRNDDSIKAVVLRVDSPGGSTVASDVIWRELMLLRARKPLVVSMSDLAASGGYYIAMPGHVIVAQPGTLTGSIGIFSGKFVTGGTYSKLGMNIEAVSEGKYAEMYSPTRVFNEAERAKVEEQMQAFYDQFVEKVAESRSSTPEKIDAIAQGRVWTGRQARERGLVDELGGLPQGAGHRPAARGHRHGYRRAGRRLPAPAERLRGAVVARRRAGRCARRWPRRCSAHGRPRGAGRGAAAAADAPPGRVARARCPGCSSR